MRSRALLLASLAAGALVFACGKDDTKPPTEVTSNDPPNKSGIGGSESPSGGDSGTATATDGGVCSSVAIGGASIAQQGVNDTLPAGTGGRIVNGVYDLVTDGKYIGLSGLAGPTGIYVTSTISVSVSAFQRVDVQLSASNVSSSTNVAGTLSVSGVNGVIDLACPLTTSSAITYTMATDETTLILYDSTANEGRTYRLR